MRINQRFNSNHATPQFRLVISHSVQIAIAVYLYTGKTVPPMVFLKLTLVGLVLTPLYSTGPQSFIPNSGAKYVLEF